MTYNEIIKIPTKTHSGFLENTLTQDITTLEAIYDLIDNSIDAARRDIFKNGNFVSDIYGMPKDYGGYCVNIAVDEKEISINDNSLGFSKNDLENRSFIVGEPSNHEFGIGQYGIGLKRALLKIGEKYSLITDDSKDRFIIDFSNKDIVGDKDFITSKVMKSQNEKSTTFIIKDLRSNILPDIQSEAWYKNAIKGISQRYTIYLEKGLKINIKYFEKQKIDIDSVLVKIRKNSRFKPFMKSYDLGSGVTAIINAGIHYRYLFPEENNYSRSNTSKISNEFGIYIICNDRIIVSHSTESIHGWKTKWHNEYNGFICIVRFISKDPSLLPMNTAKTAITVDSAIFLDAASKIQPIVDDYRKNIRRRYSGMNDEVQLGEGLYDEDDIESSERSDDEEVTTTAKPQNEDVSEEEVTSTRDHTLKESDSENKQLGLPNISEESSSNIGNKPLQIKDLTKIPVSELISLALSRADIRKLTQLYNSICTLSLKSHGSVVVIALSVFYESLGTYLGKKDDQDIHSFFNQNTIKARVTQDYTKKEFKEITNSISYIHKESNSIKHDKDYRMETAVQMIPVVEKLEKVTADMLSYYASNKNTANN